MSKITKSARGKSCTLRVSGYGGCSDKDTVVFCHAPCRDKGRGFKSPDWWGAYGCQNCHDLIDKRAKVAGYVPSYSHDQTGAAFNMTPVQRYLTEAEQDEAWLRGIYETQAQLIEAGLIEVKA